MFVAWLKRNNLPDNFESASASKLASYLCRFYTEGRCYDTRPFSGGTLSMIPTAINRHLLECGSKINVKQDPEFITAKQVYHAELKNRTKTVVRKQKKTEVTVNTPISQQDWAKLASSPALSLNTPKTLQFKIMVDFFQYFGVKGKFALQELQKEHFVLKKTPEGNEYFEFMDPDKEDYPTMMSEPGNIHCPVYGFKKYLSHLDPKCPVFLTCPRDHKSHRSETRPDHVWYTDRPLGLVFLADMMKNLSKEAGLSRLYTSKSFGIRTAPDAAIAGDFTSGDIKTHISRLFRTDTNNTQPQDALLTEEGTVAVVEIVPVAESTETDASGNLEVVSSISPPASSLTWKPLESSSKNSESAAVTTCNVPVVSEIISSQAIAHRRPGHTLRSDIGPHSAQIQKHIDVLSNVQSQAKTVAGNTESIEVDGQRNTQTPGSSATTQKRIVTPQAIQMEKQTIQEAIEIQKEIFASPPIQMKKPVATPQMFQSQS